MGFPSNFLVDFSRTRAFSWSQLSTCATSWPQSSVSGLARNNMTMEEEMACLVNKLMNRLKIILQRSRSKALRDPQEISLHVVGVPTAHKCAVSLERLTCKKRSGRRSTGAPSLTQTSWIRCPPPHTPVSPGVQRSLARHLPEEQHAASILSIGGKAKALPLRV